MGFMRKALFLGTGGLSGAAGVRANSKKERTAKSMCWQPRRWSSIDAMDRHERERWLTDHGFHNVDAIVGAAEQGDRPTIQRCCALTLNETAGGLNIYGGEGSTPQLYEHEVTEQNYKDIYLPNRWQGQNGIGPTQLTSAGYQEDANRLGGVWNAFCSCQVGFRLLHELIERYGVWGGFRSYNGSGPAAERYADEAISHERTLIAEGLR